MLSLKILLVGNILNGLLKLLSLREATVGIFVRLEQALVIPERLDDLKTAQQIENMQVNLNRIISGFAYTYLFMALLHNLVLTQNTYTSLVNLTQNALTSPHFHFVLDKSQIPLFCALFKIGEDGLPALLRAVLRWFCLWVK